MKKKLYLQASSFQLKAYDNKMNFADSLRKTSQIGFDGATFYSVKNRGEDNYSIEEMNTIKNETGLDWLCGNTPSNYEETDSFGVNRYMDKTRYYHIHHLDFTAPNPFSDTDYAIDYFSKIGCHYISLNNCSLITPERQDCLNLASYLNYLGKKAKENGNMKVSWHNHLFEFWPIDEDRVLDILIKNTNPEYVTFELDTSWCASARIKPQDLINKYSGRFELIQFREIDQYFGPQQPGYPEGPNYYITRLKENGEIERVPRMQQEADIIFANCSAGKGICDWEEIIRAGNKQKIVNWIVERGGSYNYPRDRWKCIEEDFAFYRKLLDNQ